MCFILNLFQAHYHSTTAGVVWRGLSGLALPPEFFEPDEQGFAGGVDASFMSTTLDDSVARKFSGVDQGRLGTIFKLLLGKTSLGADITFLSQFTGELEMLFPPRTHLEIVDAVFDNGVTIVTLKPTVYQNVKTYEEVVSSRKVGLKQLTSSLIWDIRNEASKDGKLDGGLVHRLDALEGKLVDDHCSQSPEFYNDDIKYKAAFQGLLREVTQAGKQVQ